MLKILLRNHGLLRTVKLLDVTLEEQKRLYKKFGGYIFKKDLYEKERLYKKKLKCANLRHRVEMKKQLCNLRSKNPKEYWKILNSDVDKQRCSADLHDLFTFYKECCNSSCLYQDESKNSVFSMEELDMLANIDLNTEINLPITHEEILKSITILKNNKACGDDRIFNEYIKSTHDCMLNLYVVLFNKIFDSGVIPTQWICGNIIPVYKNKGDNKDPQNYRPITLLSCLGKLFTAIINERLNNYADRVQLILENQAGFRKG